MSYSQAIKELSERNDRDKIDKRIKEIERHFAKLMELYQLDSFPTDVLGENINKLYNEKSALRETLAKFKQPAHVDFDFIEALLAPAAQIWDLAVDNQKRSILQGLLKRIILTADEVKIEWIF